MLVSRSPSACLSHSPAEVPCPYQTMNSGKSHCASSFMTTEPSKEGTRAVQELSADERELSID